MTTTPQRTVAPMLDAAQAAVTDDTEAMGMTVCNLLRDGAATNPDEVAVLAAIARNPAARPSTLAVLGDAMLHTEVGDAVFTHPSVTTAWLLRQHRAGEERATEALAARGEAPDAQEG